MKDFVDLAREGSFVAQKQILDQLLGQGAATLHRPPARRLATMARKIPLGIDAGMLENEAILDRQQGIHQGRWQIPPLSRMRSS